MTTSLIRAVHIDLGKFMDGEPPKQIYIVFISASPENESQYQSAQNLAEELHFENSHLYPSEYLAEWEIKPNAVQHSITLKTLLDRGLFRGWDESLLDFERVEDLRNGIGRMLFNRIRMLTSLVWGLGFMAQKFGARAPLD
jgi:hypothetical protein